MRALVPLLLVLTGCPAIDVQAPPDWWDGPGPAAADDDDLSFDDDDASPSPGADLAIVGVEDGGELRLMAFETTGGDPQELDRLPLQTKLTASGRTLFGLSGGNPSSITVATFNPGYAATTNDLPPNADPSHFVLGKTCSVMVLQGTGSALVIPKEQNSAPFFANLSSYADDDGDPDALSGFRIGERLFVGLARNGAAGPDPDGGLAVEVDCEANVLETQPIAPGALLRAGTSDPIVHVVLGADGVVHGFDADAGDWQGAAIWDDEPLERLAVSDEGALWGVAGSRLLCRFGGDAAVEVAADLEPVADIALASSGQLCVVGASQLRCWAAKGCEVKAPFSADLDGPGRAVAVITGTE